MQPEDQMQVIAHDRKRTHINCKPFCGFSDPVINPSLMAFGLLTAQKGSQNTA